MDEEQKLQEILTTYRNVVKPLLADIKVRCKDGKIPVNCLNEIRALNDHIARCYRENMDNKQITIELGKAEGHLKRLIFDCFKQLNVFLYDKIESKERKFYSSLWLYWDGGQFWNKYSQVRLSARYASIEAKKNETENAELAMKKYDEAYCDYCIIEDMLNAKRSLLWVSFLVKWGTYIVSGFWWFITTIILAIISSIICLFV